MTENDHHSPLTSLPGKLLGLTLFVMFLVLGLVGLVLPVIPGLLFLLLALYMLTRVSRRLARVAQRNSWLRRVFRRLRHVRTLPPADLLRLSFWVSARGVINGATALCRHAGALFGRDGARPH